MIYKHILSNNQIIRHVNRINDSVEDLIISELGSNSNHKIIKKNKP